jgi:hypothetical protein
LITFRFSRRRFLQSDLDSMITAGFLPLLLEALAVTSVTIMAAAIESGFGGGISTLFEALDTLSRLDTDDMPDTDEDQDWS